MPQKLQIDKWLFSATVGLALFGVVMVYSASAVIAQQENHSQFYYVLKQTLWTSIGFVAMFAAMLCGAGGEFDLAFIIFAFLLVIYRDPRALIPAAAISDSCRSFAAEQMERTCELSSL